MAINGRTLGMVQTDLVNSATTESDFRAAVGNDVAFQVDANEEELKETKTFQLTGDVLSDVTNFQLINGAISIETRFGPMRITSADILNGAITSDQILDDSITGVDIAGTSKQRFQVLDTDGTTVILELDGLIPTT